MSHNFFISVAPFFSSPSLDRNILEVFKQEKSNLGRLKRSSRSKSLSLSNSRSFSFSSRSLSLSHSRSPGGLDSRGGPQLSSRAFSRSLHPPVIQKHSQRNLCLTSDLSGDKESFTSLTETRSSSFDPCGSNSRCL